MFKKTRVIGVTLGCFLVRFGPSLMTASIFRWHYKRLIWSLSAACQAIHKTILLRPKLPILYTFLITNYGLTKGRYTQRFEKPLKEVKGNLDILIGLSRIANFSMRKVKSATYFRSVTCQIYLSNFYY